MESLNALKGNPTKRNSREFISRYFETGSKEKVFFVDFKDEYLEKGKHVHTVSLYLLGCHLAELIDELLKNHFGKFIGRVDDWYDFRYTWFLTALYHDAGSVIEDDNLTIGSCERFKSIEHHLGKHDVKNNVYQYMKSDYWNQMIGYHNTRNNPWQYDFTFSEALIKNYFFYRADNMNAVDHGILAGYIIFDRLIKNYEEAWLNTDKSENKNSYQKFTYNGLSWRKEHQAHFACIANSIIAHNVWYGLEKDEEKYGIYGLDSIVSSKATKIDMELWPLTFFLDILDTIEPVKRFSRLDPKRVWENIDIKLSEGSIVISAIGDVLKQDCEEYDNWLKGIFSLPDWLSIKINPKYIDQVIESITLIPIMDA